MPEFLNAYALSSMGIHYMADTNLRYSAKEWIDSAKNTNTSIQLCFHPEVWTLPGETMGEILAGCWADIIHEIEPCFLDNRIYSKISSNGLNKNFIKILTTIIANNN